MILSSTVLAKLSRLCDSMVRLTNHKPKLEIRMCYVKTIIICTKKNVTILYSGGSKFSLYIKYQRSGVRHVDNPTVTRLDRRLNERPALATTEMRSRYRSTKLKVP